MPQNLIETPQYDGVIAIPQDGELAAIDAGAAPLKANPFQVLANRTRYLIEALPSGTWLGRRPALYAPTTSSLYVGPTAGLVLAGVRLAARGETAVDLAAVTGAGWYYLYASDDEGAPWYALSATPPDDARVFQAGAGDLAYVGPVRATGVGAVRPFRLQDGRYLYRVSAQNRTGLRPAPSGGSSTTFADVVLDALVPPHARLVHLFAKLTTGAAAGNAHLRTAGDATDNESVLHLAAANLTAFTRDVWIECSGAQKIQYRVDTSTDDLYLEVRGFQE